MNLFTEHNNKTKSALEINNLGDIYKNNDFCQRNIAAFKTLDQNNIVQNKLYNNQDNFWEDPVYNRKMGELMEKICDESTTVCILENGDITAMKMKSIVCSYSWDREKNKFISQKNKGNKKSFKKEKELDSLKKKIFQNNNDIENCPVYRKNLIDLLDTLMNESTTIGVLQDGIIIAIKTKSVVINYKWQKNSNEFISQKVKNNKKRKINKFDTNENFEPEEVGYSDFVN